MKGEDQHHSFFSDSEIKKKKKPIESLPKEMSSLWGWGWGRGGPLGSGKAISPQLIQHTTPNEQEPLPYTSFWWVGQKLLPTPAQNSP
jgi:hypothetical protein